MYITSINFFSFFSLFFLAPDSEESFILYASEATEVNLERFKQHVADIDSVDNSRQIFAKRMNNKCHATFVMACNSPLVYSRHKNDSKIKVDYDFAFHRRCFILNAYNRFDSSYKQKFNLTADSTYRNISRGLLFFLLDLLNMFQLQDISGAYNLIESTTQEYKLLGAENNTFVRYMGDNYVLLSSIPKDRFTSEEWSRLVGLQKTLNFKQLVEDICKTNDSKIKINGSSVMETLKLFNYKCHYMEGCSDSASLDFVISNVIHVDDLGLLRDKIDGILTEPHKQYTNRYEMKTGMSEKEFVNIGIPEDSQIRVDGKLHDMFYSIISRILTGERIKLENNIHFSSEYKNTSLDEILDELSHF